MYQITKLSAVFALGCVRFFFFSSFALFSLLGARNNSVTIQYVCECVCAAWRVGIPTFYSLLWISYNDRPDCRCDRCCCCWKVMVSSDNISFACSAEQHFRSFYSTDFSLFSCSHRRIQSKAEVLFWISFCASVKHLVWERPGRCGNVNAGNVLSTSAIREMEKNNWNVLKFKRWNNISEESLKESWTNTQCSLHKRAADNFVMWTLWRILSSPQLIRLIWMSYSDTRSDCSATVRNVITAIHRLP